MPAVVARRLVVHRHYHERDRSSVMDKSDGEVVRRATAGEEEALSALLARHGPEVQERLRGKIGAQWQAAIDVADVMQVTYLEAFLRIRQFTPQETGSFLAWLTRIAENNLRDSIRALERAKRPSPRRRIGESPGEDSVVALVEVLGYTTTTPSRHAGRHEVSELVDRAVRKLPPDYATVIRLYDLEGQSADRVARVMDRSIGAVYMLRARAHDRLRELLGAESNFFFTKSS